MICRYLFMEQVVSSAMDMKDRLEIQIFLEKVAELYGYKGPIQSSLANDTTEAPTEPSVRDDPFFQRQPDPFGRPRLDPFGRPIQNSFDQTTTSTIPEYDLANDYDDEPVENKFRLFESAPKYGLLHNLLFSDSTQSFKTIKPEEMSYKSYLERSYGDSLVSPMKAIEGVRKCTVGKLIVIIFCVQSYHEVIAGDMQLCVTSEAELAKCVRMRTALNAQLLRPKMSCKRARTHLECMQKIKEGEADVVVLDAGDVYRAGWSYDLIPIMAEMYNLETPHYYAVAVTRQRDNSSELIYLKRKYTCHTGVGHAAGWIIPMAWLIGNERVRDYGCNSLRAAAEYFGKACAPGAQSAQFQNR